jgi:hypothetical protein
MRVLQEAKEAALQLAHEWADNITEGLDVEFDSIDARDGCVTVYINTREKRQLAIAQYYYHDEAVYSRLRAAIRLLQRMTIYHDDPNFDAVQQLFEDLGLPFLPMHRAPACGCAVPAPPPKAGEPIAEEAPLKKRKEPKTKRPSPLIG